MNLDIYTEEMTKSLWDKAFFMDKIPGAKCVIDFGCADGALMTLLGKLFPSVDFFGYDINDELLKRAIDRISQCPANVKSVYNAEGMTGLISRIKRNYTPDQICINFSSVLHEVFSSSPSGKAAIKRLITELKPKYITIRDMYFYEAPAPTHQYVQGPNPDWDEMKPYREAFEAVYGPIKDNAKNCLHFLMKYQWKNNGWDTELNENYFSWTIDEFKHLIGWNNYDIVFENHYQLPYLIELWKHRFFRPNLHTHAQFILRRND